MKIRAILALLALCLPPTPQAALAGPSGPAAAETQFRQAVEFYEQLDYEHAIPAFLAAIEEEALGPAQRAQAHTCLGVMYLSMDRADDALRQFVLLLEVDPEVALDYGLRSPKVMDTLREAREIYIRERRAMDTTAPVIQTSPLPGLADHGRRLDLAFRISDASRIVQAQIFFRKHGDLTYDFLPLEAQGGDVYAASIPSYAVTGTAVEYYVVAIDEAGNASIEGSAGMPLSIRVALPPELKPWYKKWWVWTVAAAVLGGAVAAGVLLSSDEDGARAAGTGSATITFGP